jgi:hypothetical protein
VGLGVIRYTLRLFGIPVLTLDTQQYELVEECGEESVQFEGGSAHNFERDYAPLSPTSHHEWEWEDRKGFGFG